MDLNHLLFRHQVSLMRANAAACRASRAAHRALAGCYAARIAALRGEYSSGITTMEAAI